MIPLAFESLTFDEFDLVISVTSEYSKGILTKPNTLHICYCLTPTRYLWSGYEEYFRSSAARFVSKPLVSFLRTWDKNAGQRPDVYIAISKTVQKRIKTYYGRESVVIYPPLTLNSKSQITDSKQMQNSNYQLPITNYFLIVSRLVPYKHVDIAIEAFNTLRLPLKIIGTGREYGRLKNMAGPTIEFVQNLTDRQLIRYYQDCTALIFPGEEDLGLSVLEAQAFGKPVIAYKAGGAAETIIEGKTGTFFYPQTQKALIDVLQRFNAHAFDPSECKKRAMRFSKEQFKREFTAILEKLVVQYKKSLGVQN